ncbi:ChbG/HpnK family deacetylase [Chryseolinea soli]|uniref:ChbG/HpnK family deacetylase n=2 Tax=Chryseolinea soli TaxID=2321403 RepID=A0A385SFG0_9BACT|nr:ChbG/HpnK family deacetylase [Chryseolinea soli]
MIVLTWVVTSVQGQSVQTYAERLGWKENDRVIIFHVDDVGMSYESNQGAVQALEKNLATSMSVMMPCPWVPGIVSEIKQHPGWDAGLHLTHTSEWTTYRWSPLSGIKATPGLVDTEGALWNNVPDVVAHASADEIEMEIRAQLSRARRMGFAPTHLDTHMGTLWSTPEYLERYSKIGIEEHIPILLPAGHNTLLLEQIHSGPLQGLKKLTAGDAQAPDNSFFLKAIQKAGEKLWQGGLAVADDLYISSYDWEFPPGVEPTDENLRKFKRDKYKELLQSTKPGITVILLHCSDAKDTFKNISDSGHTRRADLLAMTDLGLKSFCEKEGFILTTWREMQQRRDEISK